MNYYQIKGRQFTNAIDENIDEIKLFDLKCQEVAEFFGFDKKQARVMQPGSSLVYRFGGIEMSREEYDEKEEIHFYWRVPDKNSGFIVPKRGPEKALQDLWSQYHSRVKNLEVYIRFFEICTLPVEAGNHPLWKMKKGSYYFVMYPSPLLKFPMGITKVSREHYEKTTAET